MCICVLGCLLCLCYDLWPTQSAPVIILFYLRFKRWMSLIVLCICILVIFVWALFEHWSQDFNLSRTRPFFTRAKSDAVWTGGSSVGYGNLSMAVFILIYRSRHYRWASVVPWSNYSTLAVEPLGTYAQDNVRRCIEPSEGLSFCLYVHHTASHGFRKKNFFGLSLLSLNLVKVHDYYFLKSLLKYPGRVIPKTLKMVLDTTLLNTQHYKVRFKGKVEQSWEWSSALPYTLV